MRKGVLLGFGLLAAAVASAAEIHGTLSRDGKPLPKGSVLKLECAESSARAETDEFGAYSLKIGATGECRLSVEVGGASPSLRLTVYEKPSRYDIEVAAEAGKPVLRRK